jgi:hypothetical protein
MSLVTNNAVYPIRHRHQKRTSMTSIDISLFQMLCAKPNVIFVINLKDRLLKGRIISVSLIADAMQTGTFRAYEGLEKGMAYLDSPNYNDYPIRMGEFTCSEIIDLESMQTPSPIEKLVRIYLDICKVSDDKPDLGIIRGTLPKKLDAFREAFVEYFLDKSKPKNGNIEWVLQYSISDCKSCPDNFGDTLDEDKWYKCKTISLAKHTARDCMNIVFYPWAVW